MGRNSRDLLANELALRPINRPNWVGHISLMHINCPAVQDERSRVCGISHRTDYYCCNLSYEPAALRIQLRADRARTWTLVRHDSLHAMGLRSERVARTRARAKREPPTEAAAGRMLVNSRACLKGRF